MEVVLGAFIFYIVLSAMGAVWLAQEDAMRKYRNHNFARFLAVQEMESCLAQTYSELPKYILGDPGLSQPPAYPKDLVVVREVDGQEVEQTFRVTVTLPSMDAISTQILLQSDCLDDTSPPFQIATTVFYTQ